MSQDASNNIELCKFGSEEALGSLRLGNVWVDVKVDRLQSWKISIDLDSSRLSRSVHF